MEWFEEVMLLRLRSHSGSLGLEGREASHGNVGRLCLRLPSLLHCLGAAVLEAGGLPATTPVAAGGACGVGEATAAGAIRDCACVVSFRKASSMASDVIFPMSVLV